MANKILFLDASAFGASHEGGQVTSTEDCAKTWLAHASGPAILTFALSRHRFDPALGEAFEKSQGDLTCAFFQRGEDAQSSALGFLGEENRGLGVKSHLAKGSTVYSETFFRAEGAGERLDPLFRFARGKLSAAAALDAWVSFQSFLFMALRNLPGQGESGTGERVDVQVGADDKNFVYSVRFDLAPEQFAFFRRQPALELPRSCAAIMELRYIREAKKLEVAVLFPLANKAASCIEVHSVHASAAREKPENAADFNYQTFGALKNSAEPESKHLGKAGFKKKFSAQVATPVATEEKIADADAGNFLVAGEVLQSTPQVKVSGNVSMKKEEAVPTGPNPALVEAEKKVSALSTQVTNLQAKVTEKENDILELKRTIAKAPAAAPVVSSAPTAPGDWEKKYVLMENDLRDARAQVTALGKELTEIKDPSKRGIISSIKDNAEQGFKDNLEKVKKELLDSQNREKELLGVLDKAVQLKDEASKKLKEYEVKLKASSGGNNSKVVMLEKQVEEQKRQNKELSKRLTELKESMGKAA